MINISFTGAVVAFLSCDLCIGECNSTLYLRIDRTIQKMAAHTFLLTNDKLKCLLIRAGMINQLINRY